MSDKIQKLYSPQFLLGLIVTALAGTACTGQIVVSGPHVFTRERLVQERQEDQTFLAEEMKKGIPENIEFQGYRDMRQLTATYLELQAHIDPMQGDLNKIDQKIKLAEKNKDAELGDLDFQRKKLEKELEVARAKKSLADFHAGTPQTSEPASSTSSPVPPQSSPQPDEQTSKLSSKITPLEKADLHKGTEAEKTTAKGSALDRFNERVAYRNTVRSTERERRLDDVHDAYGSTLYDMQFDVTLKPTTHGDDYAEVLIELGNPYCKLKSKPNKLLDIKEEQEKYEDLDKAQHAYITDLRQTWLKELEAQYSQRVRDLQDRYLSQQLGQDDLKWLRDVVVFRLEKIAEIQDSYTVEGKKVVALSDLGFMAKAEDSNKYETLAPKAITRVTEAAGQRKKNTTKVFEALKKARSGQWDITAPSADPTVNAAVLYAIVYGVIYDEMYQGVDTNFKTALDLSPTRDEDEDFGRLVSVLRNKSISTIDYPSIRVPRDKDIDDRFAKRFRPNLCASQSIMAVSIEPKEHAQNISDVAARESFSQSLIGITAILASAGGKASGQLEKIDRQQEFAQAILRRPLAIGFGEGQNKFGWILGPKFEIRSKGRLFGGLLDYIYAPPLVGFSHQPVRHSYRTSVIAPAWTDVLEYTCTSQWFDTLAIVIPQKFNSSYCATDSDANSLTPEKAFTIRLPRPRDYLIAVTRALRRNSRHLYPSPTISYPSATTSDRGTQTFYEPQKDKPATLRQAILVEGDNLWRNPEVYVANVKASDVKVLPNMGGLYAIFDFTDLGEEPSKQRADRLFPNLGKGDSLLDLTVVTSSGTDTSKKAVHYRAAIPKVAPTETGGRIQTMAFDGSRKDNVIEITLGEGILPEDYTDIRLLVKKPKDEKWLLVDEMTSFPKVAKGGTKLSAGFGTFTEDHVIKTLFKALGGTSSSPIETVVRLGIKQYQGQDNYSFISLAPINSVVLFPDAKSMKANNLIEEITLLPRSEEKQPSASHPIKISINPDPFFKAYPGLETATKAGDVSIRASCKTCVPLQWKAGYNEEEKNYIVMPNDISIEYDNFQAEKYDLALIHNKSRIDVDGRLTVKK